MTPGITITLIICGTILILSAMSTIAKISAAKKSHDVFNKITKTLETPENNDYFKKF